MKLLSWARAATSKTRVRTPLVVEPFRTAASPCLDSEVWDVKEELFCSLDSLTTSVIKWWKLLWLKGHYTHGAFLANVTLHLYDEERNYVCRCNHTVYKAYMIPSTVWHLALDLHCVFVATVQTVEHLEAVNWHFDCAHVTRTFWTISS